MVDSNGMTFDAEFALFSASRKGKYLGVTNVSGVVTNDSSYDSNKKHWIYFEVTKSDNVKYLVGKQYKKQGKNFYPAVRNYQYPTDYKRVALVKDIFKYSNGIIA